MSKSEKLHIFLKDCIADSLIELMKTKPFEKITADEIVKLANVGRATYFRSFTSKQEVLTYKFIRHWETNAEMKGLKERQKFDVNNATAFFEINHLLRDTFNIVYASGQKSTLHEAFCRIMLPQNTENSFERYREQFYSQGLFGLLDGWIRNGYKETPSQMAEMLKQIVQKSS